MPEAKTAKRFRDRSPGPTQCNNRIPEAGIMTLGRIIQHGADDTAATALVKEAPCLILQEFLVV